MQLEFSNIIIIVGVFFNIEDVCVDWIGNNLYWTESITGNIEVLDLDTFERAVIINAGAEAVPRGIAVDPATRYNCAETIFVIIPKCCF